MAANLSSLSSLQPDDIAGINALVDETMRRESIGYISPYSRSSSQKNTLLPTCGTVEDISNDKGPSNGAANFFGSLLLGLLGIIIVNLNVKKKDRLLQSEIRM
jgi:hypothetical protein